MARGDASPLPAETSSAIVGRVVNFYEWTSRVMNERAGPYLFAGNQFDSTAPLHKTASAYRRGTVKSSRITRCYRTGSDEFCRRTPRENTLQCSDVTMFVEGTEQVFCKCCPHNLVR
ncbi:hypothetical protein EVAR_12761_1 [Eumeta japonica]|uniref:Uncharacterized protein n=1 Tax=Eumeta variegata TaxID=151549 RepID=A0A4C1UAR5_EUMVA|nr:hypothetical protein EVAR_12761_1 [Eumeta japonica]